MILTVQVVMGWVGSAGCAARERLFLPRVHRGRDAGMGRRPTGAAGRYPLWTAGGGTEPRPPCNLLTIERDGIE